MDHNVTNYSGGRVSDFQTAYFADFQGRHARPDVFVAEEIVNGSALSTLLGAMNSASGSSGDYVAAPFVAGPDTNSVMIYRSSRVVLDSYKIVSYGGASPEPPRNTMRYDVHLSGYSGLKAQLSIYVVHLKAGTTQTDMDRRLLECQRIRADAESLGGRPFLIAGDFNIHNSSETSYVELVGSQSNNAGRFFDPIDTPGNWYSNSSMKFVHTQDPTPGQAGMDDRYDFILLNSDLIDKDGFDYLGDATKPYSTTTWNDPNHSYRAWGNDGTCYNTSLTVTNNQMVGSTIAQAIINTTANQSGHIPVLLDLLVPPKASHSGPIDFGVLRVGQSAQRTLTVTNSADVAKWGASGIADLRFTLTASPGFTVPVNPFDVLAANSVNCLVSVDTSSPGLKTGTVTITSNDPDLPVQTVPARAMVVNLSQIRPHG